MHIHIFTTNDVIRKLKVNGLNLEQFLPRHHFRHEKASSKSTNLKTTDADKLLINSGIVLINRVFTKVWILISVTEFIVITHSNERWTI